VTPSETPRDSLPSSSSSISIVIISKGRPEVLDDTLESLSRQTLLPVAIVVVVPTEADLPRQSWGNLVRLIVGFNGGCVQRNRGIEAIPLSVDYVGFFDDDFELRRDYLAEAVRFMQGHPEIAALSGLVVADGNISRAEARHAVDVFQPSSGEPDFRSTGKFHSLYGCNMVVRRALLEQERFDENLALYSFAEDYDLSIRLERHGKVGKYDRCIGVHLAAPGGRVREIQRGYAFVANPWYFLKKGTSHLSPFMTWVRFWAVCAGKTCAISLWKLVTGDRSADWAGRLKGSLLAIKDILLGRSHPGRVKDL
jgi:GT2 family glycosyltransferase